MELIDKFPLARLRRTENPADLFVEGTARDIPALAYASPKVLVSCLLYNFAKRVASNPGGVLNRKAKSVVARELLRANVAVVGVPLYVALKLKSTMGLSEFLDVEKRPSFKVAVGQSFLAAITPKCRIDRNGWCGMEDSSFARLWLLAHTTLISKTCRDVFRDDIETPTQYALIAPQAIQGVDRFVTLRIAMVWSLITKQLSDGIRLRKG